MKLVIAFTRPEIAVPIIREGNCYNFFLFSVIEKDTRRFVKFSPRNALIDVAEIRRVFSKKRVFFASEAIEFFLFPTRNSAGH